MKKIISIGAGMLLAGFVLAGDSQPLVLINKIASTNTVISEAFNGFLDSIYIDLVAGSTGVLTVTRGGETVMSNTNTVDATLRPSTVRQSAVNVTNIPALYDRFLLVGEKLTFSLVEYGPVTNTYSILIRVDNK
jgi:hypothetical protein